ncbi:hypothetical protein O181_132686 [Austropuccinia psidii MF-1]|uniref:Uncharacterized protein n=1 Tax=Austropuccinia psidii MF-1 TaxID=1389203 RepID=A0A9Q3QBE1_9BASI|nr:hypothetical protein [Austropuccinia psidii MF-1]
MSQPRVWPSSLMAAAIQRRAKLGPIGHVIPFMANWPPWVLYGIHAITPSNGHNLPSLAFLANSHFTNPQAFIFDFGPGGSFCLLRASRPPSHHPWIQGHPFHSWCFGHLGPLRLLRPVGHGPRSAVRTVGPKPQLGPPEPFLATTSLDPKMSKNLMDTILAINPIGLNFRYGPP